MSILPMKMVVLNIIHLDLRHNYIVIFYSIHTIYYHIIDVYGNIESMMIYKLDGQG